MRRFFMLVVLSAGLAALFVTGCSMLAEPELSENYALNGKCDIEQLVDGSMYTTGKTHTPPHRAGQKVEDESRFTQTIVTLPKPKDIRKVIIRRRSEDAVAVDINIDAMVDGQWKTVKEARGLVAADISLNVKANTDKI